MLFRKEKKCLLRKLFTIVVLLFAPFFIVSNITSSVSALNVSYTQFGVYTSNFNDGCSNYYYGEGIAFNTRYYMCNMRSFLAESNSVTSTGNYVTLYGKVNIVASKWLAESGTYMGSFTNLNNIHVIAVGQKDVPNGAIEVVSSDLQYYVTEWTNNSGDLVETLTVIFSISAKNVVTNINTKFRVLIGNDTLPIYQTSNNLSSYYYFEPTDTPFMINFQNNSQDSLLQLQINQNQQIIDENNQAVNNIDNQSTSDISDATSSQTTSIIGTISSFVTALGTVQTGSCELTLPFPQFIGGNTTVNPCTGKDKAPTIVQVGSSMFLIGVFIPFAFMVLKMIYNEIRSFTNG